MVSFFILKIKALINKISEFNFNFKNKFLTLKIKKKPKKNQKLSTLGKYNWNLLHDISTVNMKKEIKLKECVKVFRYLFPFIVEDKHFACHI